MNSPSSYYQKLALNNPSTGEVSNRDMEGVYRFAAAIVDLLRKDSKSLSECETIRHHSVNVCAHMFLTDIEEYSNQPDVDLDDIASEVFRLHTWQP